jgi:hypothetical protein
MNRARLPKLLCDLHWRDIHVRPPVRFVAMPMQFVMVDTAERHGKFIADFST